MILAVLAKFDTNGYDSSLNIYKFETVEAAKAYADTITNVGQGTWFEHDQGGMYRQSILGEFWIMP